MKEPNFKELQASSYLSGSNADYIESLYEDFLKNPANVPDEWRNYFISLKKDQASAADISHSDIRDYFLNLSKRTGFVAPVSGDINAVIKQANVDHFITAYRLYGHLAAKIDPLEEPRSPAPQLQLSTYHLSEADFDEKFVSQTLMGKNQVSLRDIYTTLHDTYCESIGAEYMYISNQEEVQWIRERLESARSKPNFSNKTKIEILRLLTAADGLEKYLGTKYVGQKRFSLEGGDALIPLLDEVIQRAGNEGVKEVVIGMAHRGRLNVLINIMGQSPEELFNEFEGKKDYGMTSGDVKYHNGFSSDVDTQGGPVHLSLAFNPSHLEVIDAVVMGSVRARQDRYGSQRSHVMPILIHGDAAFAGQGIVMETLNMSQTRAYGVGGTVHIVINNQVGFTTSCPQDARSSLYCTDIAKMIDAPVFHVNGDDPEAVVFLAQLATDYRMKFHKDVIIDLVCYRRHGHNEADEPAATQPLMYGKIHQHITPRELYAEKLIAEHVCTQTEADKLAKEYQAAMDAKKRVVKLVPDGLSAKIREVWAPFIGKTWETPAITGVSKKKLMELGKKLTEFPKGFTFQRQVGHMEEARVQMAQGKLPLDWGFAENLAYASLLTEGYGVRISGQDSRRGTFAHRHVALHDNKTGQTYVPLAHLDSKQAAFQCYDSLLSEYGVLGFEYGYSKAEPDKLVAWEAQFGDFANGAQIVIDQFISSAWEKWQRLSGLTMLLPHGYEGMGPEHSSARLERYLQLCAQENMQVCVPSTPAQIFHLLRRQVIRPFRRPLIVMTPKSLLRHKSAVSSLDELANGEFQNVIPEVDANIKLEKVTRVILCSGKVYYDILAKRQEKKLKDVAVIRLEQLYPFPYEILKAVLKPYKKAKDIVWCQEEPQNQGAWFIIKARIEECMSPMQTLHYAGRPPSASSAAGYAALHNKQQTALIDEALG